MMMNATIDKMRSLRLLGMLEGLEDQLRLSDVGQMSFEERLGLLVDREESTRNEKQTKSRLKMARLKDKSACIEDLDFKTPRGLDKATILSLASCEWIRQHQNLVITGPTGIGKGFISSCLIQRACMAGYKALFIRIPRLFAELALARVDGNYYKLMTAYSRVDVLVLDDWGQTLSETERRDLLEIIEDRYGIGSTVITTQIPIDQWPAVIGDPTVADAVMDRLLANAHKLHLTGPSMRKMRAVTRGENK